MLTDEQSAAAHQHMINIQGFFHNMVSDHHQTDLTARQMELYLKVYNAKLNSPPLDDELYTVRRLAEEMGVSKPAITRALNRLTDLDLIIRKIDPLDRRSVLILRTKTGIANYAKWLEAVGVLWGIIAKRKPIKPTAIESAPSASVRRGRSSVGNVDGPIEL